MTDENKADLGRKLDAFLYLRELIPELENGAFDYGKEAAEQRLRNLKEILGISEEKGLLEAKIQLLKDFRKSLLEDGFIRYEALGPNFKSEILALSAYSYTTKTSYEVTFGLNEDLSPKLEFHSASWQNRLDGIGKGAIEVETIE